ncbi:methyl-accepting chemotaxis protein [Methanosalsum natronophilum]|uniref:methyl-accepting chemotaxis protein n=1 Tax=Methanosalsum natronophilum TaxID=768733 RepID=UPI00216A44D7|nr:methyl-accepting chemotaxis protein [Methanosalsum natronophilum]MCS3924551.1 methyl-accepting chemotaxis protein [Methanosalsum natronophilum]
MKFNSEKLKEKTNIDLSSVKIKTTVYVVVALIAIFAVSGVLIINSVNEMQTEMAYDAVMDEAEIYANDIDSDLREYMTAANTLSATLSQYESNDRDEVNRIVRQILLNNENFDGVYVAYEPNAFDGNDEAFVDEVGHDSTGRFIPYWYRDGNTIELEPLVDYEIEDYYQLPKQLERDVVTEPYMYQGQLLSSFVSPIIVNGEFIGIAGTDVSLFYLDEMMDDVVLFDTGYALLLSNEGMIITHPEDKSLMGTQNIADFDDPIFDEIQRDVANGISGQVSGISPVTGENVVYSYSTIDTGEYAVLAVVPENEMLAGVSALQTQIITIFIIAVGLMALLSYFIIGSIANPMRAAATRAENIANGNLTGQIDKKFIGRKDEVGILATSFGTMLENLNQLVSGIKQSADDTSARAQEMSATSEETTASANQIADTVSEISRGAQTQSAKVEEVARAMNDMNDSVQSVAENSQKASEDADDISSKIQVIGNASQDLLQKMNGIRKTSEKNAAVISQLDQKSTEIGKIVNLITNIADQTNLLALNAAIEAARAGEHGRGFAVVADEVKKLADESGSAAKQIEELITEIQDSTHNAVESMNESKSEIETGAKSLDETVESIQAIVSDVNEISKMVQEIAAAAQEQSASIEEVTASVEEVSSISEESAASTQEASAAVEQQTASMQEISNAAQELAEMADKLQRDVSYFKLNSEDGENDNNK